MAEFKIVSDYKPTGDQPEAIEKLVKGFNEGKKFQTLLGVTGSGKTEMLFYPMAYAWSQKKRRFVRTFYLRIRYGFSLTVVQLVPLLNRHCFVIHVRYL